MTVLITLTTIGADAGPFNLYSNLDGYTLAFASGITRLQLLLGYSANVPDYTTSVRVMSIGNCTNHIDIVLDAITTTTTTTSI